MAENDLRADLEAAFGEEEAAPEPIETPTEAPEEVPELETKTSDPVEETETQVTEDVPRETSEKPEEEAPVKASAKPPIDWKPDLKEKWSSLDPSVQEAIHGREVEVNRVLQETADARRVADQYNQMVNSYAPVFAAEGVQDPMQGLQGLINITAELQMGNPQQKAQRIAGLIQHYGVDIGTLDTILSGENPVSEEESRIQQMLDQRLGPVNAMMQRLQYAEQQQQGRMSQEADNEIATFAANPENKYFEQVRMVMADLVQMANANGQELSLQEAYDRACAIDPNISAEIQQARIAEAAAQRNAQTAKRQVAASSISGRASGEPAVDPGNLRATLESAFENQGRL